MNISWFETTLYLHFSSQNKFYLSIQTSSTLTSTRTMDDWKPPSSESHLFIPWKKFPQFNLACAYAIGFTINIFFIVGVTWVYKEHTNVSWNATLLHRLNWGITRTYWNWMLLFNDMLHYIIYEIDNFDHIVVLKTYYRICYHYIKARRTMIHVC